MVAVFTITAPGCDDTSANSDASDSDTVQTAQDTSDGVDTQSITAADTAAQPDAALADTEPGPDVADTSVADTAADAIEDTTALEDADAADTSAADTATPVTLLDPLPVVVPDGFVVDTAGRGFTVYRHDWAGGEPDFVTVIDLRIAELHSVVGVTYPPPTASVQQRAAITHWDDAVAKAKALRARARVLVDGSFFSPSPDPAPLAHGLAVDGEVVSYGYGLEEFPGYVNTFAWNNAEDEAAIAPYEIGTFEAYPDVVGGFKTDVAHPAADAYAARVFVGVRDYDGDGRAEAVFFAASELLKQAEAQALLTDFGATAASMWGGGSSAFFILDGKERVAPGRRVPHAVAVYEPVDYGCASPCPDRSACDPALGQCVCDAGYSGPSCETCAGCAPSEVIVDDADAGFTTFGQTYWYSVADHDAFLTRAYAAGVHYTFGDPGGMLVWTGRWLTPTPLRGTYKVEVHLAAPDAFDPEPSEAAVDAWTPCDAVRYVLLHDGAPTGELVTLDHHVPGWITLKDAVTYTDRPGDVRSDDHATPQYCAVQFDAIRWTRVTP
jgi:hypothetical protein